jgi:hypothetical protein
MSLRRHISSPPNGIFPLILSFPRQGRRDLESAHVEAGQKDPIPSFPCQPP